MLIKRILASIINLLVIIVCILVLYPVLAFFNITLEQEYFLLIAFSVSYFIPIVYFKNTIGFKILKIQINSSQRALIKYVIYYILLSGMLSKSIRMLTELASHYNYSLPHLQIQFIYLVISIILVSFLYFFFSNGKFNLLDFVFNIQPLKAKYKRTGIIILVTWFFISYLTFFLGIWGRISFINEYINRYINFDLGYKIGCYFPKEIFDEFSTFQLEKTEASDLVFTYSDKRTFHNDIIKNQKTIFALINKATFESEIKRLIACNYLKVYSEISNSFDYQEEPDQTKVILIYNIQNTFFTMKSYSYVYYCDNKVPNSNFYGGINLDSLCIQYKTKTQRMLNIFNESLATSLGISIDSVKNYCDSTGKATITNKEYQTFKNVYFKNLHEYSALVVHKIPFGDVKPKYMLSFNIKGFEKNSIEVMNNRLMDDDYFEAVNLRNYYSVVLNR